MLKTIEQSVYFPATPALLYEIFMDQKKHAAMTGAPVKLSRKPLGKFTAFGGMLEGTTLHTIPNQLIVQRWRSTAWKKSDLDSTLILTFHKKGPGCQLHLVHVNVPPHDFQGVTSGWKKYYWTPLKSYLKSH